VIGTGGDPSGAPCDLELVRPIESSVLRLLTRRPDLAASHERRLSTRVALGTPVSVTVRRRPARSDDLADLDRRLRARQPGALAHGRARGDRAAAELSAPAPPRALGGSARLAPSCRPATGCTFDVSVAIRALDLVDRVTLRALMARTPIDFRPRSEGSSGRGDRGLRERTLLPTRDAGARCGADSSSA